MDILYLITFIVFAVVFTVCAVKITYGESKHLCKILAFVWWLCAVAQFIHVIVY